MASSSGPRWRLACDGCDASAWVGAGERGFDAWCEACQHAQSLAAAPDATSRCERCGVQLPAVPRFVELWGLLQHLDAVLAAWAGDASPLATLLPERPVFLTDLTPPVGAADDPAPLHSQLAAAARGDWRAVLAAPVTATGPAGMRAHAARAIAHERAGDPAAAITEWSAVLEGGEDERARLARGALLARTGRLDEASEDLRLAGQAFAARWSRAALLVTAAVNGTSAVPDAEAIARARAEAGAPSSYWSDPTVGRLLFSLLVSRTLATHGPRRASDAERSMLRAAEHQLEHETFWDRALALVGWLRVGAPDEAARVAQPLARTEASALAAEPALAGAALADTARALGETIRAIDAGEPRAARAALVGALARPDLKRFRIPCRRCSRGSVGVDEVLEAFPAEH